MSIGNFDGVHLGHQRLLSRARTLAAGSAPVLALTFDPHPLELLRPESGMVPLTRLPRRVELLERFGADEVLVIDVDREFLNYSPSEFFDNVIVRGLNPIAIVEGPDFGFGRGRSGTVSELRGFSNSRGIQLDVVPHLEISGAVVSSSNVRRRIEDGDIAQANQMLGWHYRVDGRVVTGEGRGQKLGFPTANLTDCDTLIPPVGVYAGYTRRNREVFAVALNVGPNPTFGEHAFKVEAHLIGFTGDLVGQQVSICLLEFLRATEAFAGLDELTRQIDSDVRATVELYERIKSEPGLLAD